MNRDNIQYTIDLLRRAENFCISSFQEDVGYRPDEDEIEDDGPRLVDSIEELHRCGNTACIAGYVAVSPLWKQLGNHVDLDDGMPMPGMSYVTPEEVQQASGDATLAALMKFWGLPQRYVDALVYGSYYRHVLLGVHTQEEEWCYLTAEGAAKIFEDILKRGVQ